MRNKNPKRTAIRHSKQLNNGKYQQIKELANANAGQKDDFLVSYAHIKYLDRLKSNKIRDGLVKQGFMSKHGLKARAWKLVLNDALQTIDMYWEATIKDVAGHIYRNDNLTSEEKKIALKNIRKLEDVQRLFNRDVPETPTRIRNYLIRRIRKSLGKRPRVNLHRSMTYDQEMYRVFMNNGTQYISLMSIGKERVVVPLEGRSTISGNIRIILNRENKTINIHVPQDVKISEKASGDSIGTDFGLSELFADSDGGKWYPEFWDETKKYADMVNQKGKNRNKIYAFEKQLRDKNPQKAKRVRKYNLGKKKQSRIKQRFRGRLETNINTTLNKFLSEKQPCRIAVEDLSHYRPPLGKGWFSRQASFWVREIINKRFTFKAMVRGSNLESVNTAYSSQMCSRCGYVDRLNRKGDTFKCHSCGMMCDADCNASQNNLVRMDDDEIKLWMYPPMVKSILIRRFENHNTNNKNDGDVVTVSGKTPDTDNDTSLRLVGQSESETPNVSMLTHI